MSITQITRYFSGDLGQRSRGAASPDAIERDLDRLCAALDPTATITFEDSTTRAGGLRPENFASGVDLTDTVVGNRTITDTTTANADTGTLTALLSMIGNMIKAVVGGATWRSAVPITLTDTKAHVDAVAPHSGHETPAGAQAKVDAHSTLTSNPHSTTALQVGAYTKAETDATIDTEILTHSASNAHDSRYYTKDQLDTYLSGGDTVIHYEVFTITVADNGDGTFTYTNADSESIVAPLGSSGEQTFYLVDGTYLADNNRVELWINDTLHRSQASGGLTEVESGDAVILTDPQGVDAEITIRYFSRIALAGQYTVILSESTPAASEDDKMWFKVVG